jgi:hypothetical protein
MEISGVGHSHSYPYIALTNVYVLVLAWCRTHVVGKG